MANQGTTQSPPVLNQYFLGAPSREDERAIEDIRRNFVLMITHTDNLHGLWVQCMARNEPFEWSNLQQVSNLLARQMANLNTLLHGGYKHESIVDKETRNLPKKDDEGNIVKDSDGSVVMEAKEITVTKYRDVPIPGIANKLKALHVFPAPPFPMLHGNAAGMSSTLLRKRMEPMEEGWVEGYLKKAAEFVDLPTEWDVQPQKPQEKEVTDEADGEVEEDDGLISGLQAKRIPSKLSEEDILDMWGRAHQEAFDRSYQKQHYPDEYGGNEEDEDDGEEDGDEDDDEDGDENEEDDFEDAMDVDTTAKTEAEQAQISTGVPAPAASTISTAPKPEVKPEVHKAIPGLAPLSIGFVHKFMSTGEVPK